jgi:peroxiredoxin
LFEIKDHLKKKVATVFGVIGFVGMILACVFIYMGRLFDVFAFTAIAAFCSYIFLLYTQSKVAVGAAFLTHIIGLVALYYSGSMMYLSIPYILLPFIALTIRGMWLEKLAHTAGLWIEPLFYFVALAIYGVELFMNHNLHLDAKLFPIAFFIVNGVMIGDVFLDGIKIRKRVKNGNGLAAGEVAPTFCLQNENNENVCLADFKGKHHVLLIFVRGEWCPMCHIMLRTYMKESVQFKEKNVFLLVVGPDPTGVNKKMAQDLKLDFHILSDPGLKVTHSYRLKIKAEHLLHAASYNEEKEIPLPASFLIDINGLIRYCSNPDKIGEVVKLNDIFPVLQTIDQAPAKA